MDAGVGIILAGGRSLRLYPETKPKPLLEVGGKTLIEMALLRLKTLRPMVVCSLEISEVIKKTFDQKKLKHPTFIIEPMPRDTAAAVGHALSTLKDSKPSWVAVISGDHWLPDPASYENFLNQVKVEIETFPNALFVAGSTSSSKPEASHSQFGWILASKDSKKALSLKVERFVEKPRDAVLKDLKSKGGLINGGIFFGKYETFLRAYEEFYPEVLRADCVFSELKKLPIDRAIFEKYKEVRVMPLEFQWEDLGTWKDVYSQVGEGRGVRKNAKEVFISSESEFEVHAYGVEDLAIVQRGNKILVTKLSTSNQLKDFVEEKSS